MNRLKPPFINTQHRLARDRQQKDTAENIHHILAQSRGGSNTEQNKVRLYQHIHSSIHTLFGNEDLVGKIEKLLAIENTALKQAVIEDIQRLINKRKDKNIYLNECGSQNHLQL